MILALTLCLAAVAALSWLIFTCAVYALPLSVGAVAALAVHRTGGGMVGALAVGGFAAALTLVLGQQLFARATFNFRASAAHCCLCGTGGLCRLPCGASPHRVAGAFTRMAGAVQCCSRTSSWLSRCHSPVAKRPSPAMHRAGMGRHTRSADRGASSQRPLSRPAHQRVLGQRGREGASRGRSLARPRSCPRRPQSVAESISEGGRHPCERLMALARPLDLLHGLSLRATVRA